MHTNKNKKSDARRAGLAEFGTIHCLRKGVIESGKFAGLPTIKEMAKPLLPQIRFN